MVKITANPQSPRIYALYLSLCHWQVCGSGPYLENESEGIAAERSCEEVDQLLKKIGMWLSLEGLGVSEDDVTIADNSQVLPDYKSNPRIASRDEIHELLTKSFRR